MALTRSYHFSYCLLRECMCIFISECCLDSVLFINSQQCHGPVQILFLESEEEFLLLEVIIQFYLLKCGKLRDFRERRGAGLVRLFVTWENECWGLGSVVNWEECPFSFFKTTSCDGLFLFLLSNNDKLCCLIMINQYYFQEMDNSENQ